MTTIRRIAIYIESRIPITQIQLNHTYTAKFLKVLEKEGCGKSKLSVILLKEAFNSSSLSELENQIKYTASLISFEKRTGVKSTGSASAISLVCKKAIKKALDNR